MRNRLPLIIFVFVLSETPRAIAQTTVGGTAITNSTWLFLSLVVVGAVWGITLFLRHKQKKNSRKRKELQNGLASVRQTLDTLTRDRQAIIKQRAKALEKELDLLKQNLKAMEETLQAGKLSARRNSMLMVRISNTLRTNLNDILGFSSLLGNEFAMNEEPELFEYNENIQRSGEALIHLLNNIIDISKIESKSFSLKETACNITEITQSLIEHFRPVAEQKGIRIVFKEEETPIFAADKQAIKHILTNLIDNAIRYTEKGFIKISQSFNGKEIVWAIKDTGIGIDKAYLPDIFEPFRQQSLGYSKTTYQGAGLGLPLVKGMLKIMGGDIELESEKAVGTTVRVFFPFKKYTPGNIPSPEVAKPPKKATATPDTQLQKPGKRVLVLDGDRLEGMLIKKILTGDDVVLYDTGIPPEEWINSIFSGETLPDIILLELDFSGKGRGKDVLKKIREKFPRVAGIPVVALSAYPDATGEEEALQAGFTACLRKPFRKNELISIINRF